MRHADQVAGGVDVNMADEAGPVGQVADQKLGDGAGEVQLADTGQTLVVQHGEGQARERIKARAPCRCRVR